MGSDRRLRPARGLPDRRVRLPLHAAPRASPPRRRRSEDHRVPPPTTDEPLRSSGWTIDGTVRGATLYMVGDHARREVGAVLARSLPRRVSATAPADIT